MLDPVDASADPGELTDEPMPIPLAGVLLVTTATGAAGGDVWVGAAGTVEEAVSPGVEGDCGTDVWTGFGGCVEAGGLVGHGLLGVDPCWLGSNAVGG